MALLTLHLEAESVSSFITPRFLFIFEGGRRDYLLYRKEINLFPISSRRYCGIYGRRDEEEANNKNQWHPLRILLSNNKLIIVGGGQCPPFVNLMWTVDCVVLGRRRAAAG